jgi:hypothetical protein
MKQDDQILWERYIDDLCLLGRNVQGAEEAEVKSWSARWIELIENGNPFVWHHGVLKLFSWFVVDRCSHIQRSRQAEIKAKIYDLLEKYLPLEPSKQLVREKLKDIDWNTLKSRVSLELRN